MQMRPLQGQAGLCDEWTGEVQRGSWRMGVREGGHAGPVSSLSPLTGQGVRTQGQEQRGLKASSVALRFGQVLCLPLHATVQGSAIQTCAAACQGVMKLFTRFRSVILKGLE